MKLFPVLHVSVGVFLTWYTIALLFNTTTIDVNYDRVRVRHHPIWWPGNRHLDAAQIKSVFVKESSVKKNEQSVWNVMIDTTDDRRVALLARVDDQDQALYIAQEIKKFLALSEQPAA
jgi:hypothetical protein